VKLMKLPAITARRCFGAASRVSARPISLPTYAFMQWQGGTSDPAQTGLQTRHDRAEVATKQLVVSSRAAVAAVNSP
jgi:hypothetical protein